MSPPHHTCYNKSSREAAIVKVCILASSSSGNATFIGTNSTRLLIDAGLSCKALFERLAAIGEDPGKLDGILITHEHSDHIAGIAVTARRFASKFKRRLPIYITPRTAATIPWSEGDPELREFQAGTGFTIGNIDVQSFTLPHDAADPVGYHFRAGGLKLGVATDLGYIPDSVKHHLKGSDFLILESNHDIEMLKVGPYPWQVKQRVMSRRGHLSNDVVGDYLGAEFDLTPRVLVLGHLSANNNHPEIARVTAQQALDRRNLDTRLVVALPKEQSEIFEFD